MWSQVLGRKGRGRRSRPSLEALETRVTPTTFKVNTLLDTVAVNLKTGKDSAGHISLRSAIMAANAHGGSNTIMLPSGTYTLTIPGANEDNDATGDLDIRDNLTIKGKGSASTVIDGNNLDRVFDVLGGKVSISNVTIQHGRAVGEGGGGLLNAGGKVTLTGVQFVNNISVGVSGSQGGSGASGSSGTAGGGGANGTSGQGGAIFNAAGALSLVNSVVSSNQAVGGDGGTGGNGGFGGGPAGTATSLNGQTGTGGNGGSGGAAGNAQGGGIFNAAGAVLSISGSMFSSNRAAGGQGGQGGSGNIGAGGSGDFGLFGPPGNGGDGDGGSGGNGGNAGLGQGGGVFNLGALTLSGTPTSFQSNVAIGGAAGGGGTGGNGVGGSGGYGVAGSIEGGNGGEGTAGRGALGGAGGAGAGGGIFNGGTATATAALTFASNLAAGNLGGTGGSAGYATGGRGGDGGPTGNFNVELGGGANGGAGGDGGFGGLGRGGGIFNDTGASLAFSAPKNTKKAPTSTFTANLANGGGGGGSGIGGSALGGSGGNIDLLSNSPPSTTFGGFGGGAVSGQGGDGGPGLNGLGGGLFTDGTASFLGVTVNFTGNNQGNGGEGASGGAAGSAQSGNGGNGPRGGGGGTVGGGSGGAGGIGGTGAGGGIEVSQMGSLTIKPRQGAKKGSAQANASNSITSNQAFAGIGASGGRSGGVTDGDGGVPNGPLAPVFFGQAGAAGAVGIGLGGGISISGVATIDNTNITGNQASTGDNDVNGTFSM